MQIQQTKRDQIENNLHFLGFLVMENKLKDVTCETIATLNKCNIRTIMATGDNTLTAISVARECNILNKELDVFYGDVQDDNLVWKCSNSKGFDAFDDGIPQAENSNETNKAPWEDLDGDSYSVALNGKAL